MLSLSYKNGRLISAVFETVFLKTSLLTPYMKKIYLLFFF